MDMDNETISALSLAVGVISGAMATWWPQIRSLVRERARRRLVAQLAAQGRSPRSIREITEISDSTPHEPPSDS